MIHTVTVDDRPAVAAYVDAEFNIVDDEKSAVMVKVTFTDEEGGVVILRVEK